MKKEGLIRLAAAAALSGVVGLGIDSASAKEPLVEMVGKQLLIINSHYTDEVLEGLQIAEKACDIKAIGTLPFSKQSLQGELYGHENITPGKTIVICEKDSIDPDKLRQLQTPGVEH